MAEQGKVDEVFVEIRARVDKLERAFKRGERQSRKFGKKSANEIEKGFNQELPRLAKTIAAGLAAAFAAVRVIDFVRGQMLAVDAAEKTAERLGLTTDRLIELDLAARRTGVGTQTLAMALQRMVRRVSEAAQGTGEAQTALEELGLDAAALARLSPDQQFHAIAGAMQSVANRGDQVRLAMRLFDSEGVALVNTLRLGTSGLRDMAREANDLGLTIGDAGDQVEAANDAIDAMKDASAGAGREIAISLSGTLEKLANHISEGVKALRQLREETQKYEGAGFSDTLEEERLAVAGNIRQLEAQLKQGQRLNPLLATAVGGLQSLFGSGGPDTLADKRLQQLRDLREELARINAERAKQDNQQDTPRAAGPGNLPGLGGFLGGAGASIAQALDQAAAAQERAANQEESRSQILGDLQAQLSQAVLTEEELTIARLKANDATEAEIAQARELQNALQATLAEKQREARLNAQASSVIEMTKTPEERLAESLDMINSLREKGKITAEQAARAEAKYREQIMGVVKAKEAAEGSGSAQEGNLLSFGGALNAARNAAQSVRNRAATGINGAMAMAGAGRQERQQEGTRESRVKMVHDAKLTEAVGEFLAAFKQQDFSGGVTA